MHDSVVETLDDRIVPENVVPPECTVETAPADVREDVNYPDDPNVASMTPDAESRIEKESYHNGAPVDHGSADNAGSDAKRESVLAAEDLDDMANSEREQSFLDAVAAALAGGDEDKRASKVSHRSSVESDNVAVSAWLQAATVASGDSPVALPGTTTHTCSLQ